MNQSKSIAEEVKLSISGKERNRLFVNREGEFADYSGVSGLDNPADSRVFATWDFDRDGWSDIAVVNANRPVLNIYRNRIGEQVGNRGRFIAVRFVGGNLTKKHIELDDVERRLRRQSISGGGRTLVDARVSVR